MFLNTDDLKSPLEIDSKLFEIIEEVILNDYFEDLPDFTITFVEPETIRELNRTYRKTDAVTDVLSFESDGEIDPETGKEYLGDIIICLQQATKQAELSGLDVLSAARVFQRRSAGSL